MRPTGLFNIAAILALTAWVAHADTIQFLGVPTGVNDGNYYVMPYEVAIDGAPQLVACFDVFDDVNFGDVWQAQLLNLNQAAASGFFSTTVNTMAEFAMAEYEKVAWLDAQTYDSNARQIGLQYAIWNVFGTYRSTAESRVYSAAADAAAATNYAGFDFSGVRFIQQTGATAGAAGTEQAFVYWDVNAKASPVMLAQSAVQVNGAAASPEPATALLFLIGGLLVAISLRVRRSPDSQGPGSTGVSPDMPYPNWQNPPPQSPPSL
jgi:hypothetical protein